MNKRIDSEKSLRDIWSKAIPRLRPNRFNSIASYVPGLILGCIPLIVGPIPEFLRITLPLVDLLAQVLGGVLGVVITGFVLAVTVVDKELVVKMWVHEDSYSKFPTYKVHVLQFCKALIICLICFFLSLTGSIFLRFLPAISSLFSESHYLRLRLPGQITVLFICGAIVGNVAIQLKAFLYNLYKFSVTQVQYWLQKDTDAG